MEYLKPYRISLEEYESVVAGREYWDDGAYEWSESSMELKLVRLAGFVQMGGNLKKIINRYVKGKKDYIRERIQFCILNYLLKLMTWDRINSTDRIMPLVCRIKRLNKDELVKLLSAELKRDVVKDYKMDENMNQHEHWRFLSEEDYVSDDILDKIERKHWHDNPDETFYVYWYREKLWDYRSLW